MNLNILHCQKHHYKCKLYISYTNYLTFRWNRSWSHVSSVLSQATLVLFDASPMNRLHGDLKQLQGQHAAIFTWITRTNPLLFVIHKGSPCNQRNILTGFSMKMIVNPIVVNIFPTSHLWWPVSQASWVVLKALFNWLFQGMPDEHRLRNTKGMKPLKLSTRKIVSQIGSFPQVRENMFKTYVQPPPTKWTPSPVRSSYNLNSIFRGQFHQLYTHLTNICHEKP